MKGKKMVFAVMLSLIVCLLLVPTCAFAETEPTETLETPVEEPVIPETPVEGTEIPQTPVEGTEIPQTPVEGGDNPETPVEGGETPKAPAEGGETPKTPVDGGENPTPPVAGGENPAAPAAGGENDGSFMVEFSYGDKTYKLENLKGNDQFGLNDILKELGIEGNIDDAKGDADDLFAAENGEEGWRVTTKKAFNTKQTLTLVVDGVEYVITVKDDNQKTVMSYDELTSAINGDTSVIIIGADFTLTDKVVINKGKTITIDLNGHTLTGLSSDAAQKASKEGGAFFNYGELTINDSSENKTGTVNGGCYFAVFNNVGASATLNGGNYTRTQHGHANGYVIKNLGTMVINDGVKVTSKIDHGASLIANGWTAGYGGKTDMNDYNVARPEGAVATLTINGGYYDGGTTTILNNDFGKLKITDGTFLNKDFLVIQNNNEAEITGGTFTNNKAPIYNYGDGSNGDSGKLTISGGTFNSGDGYSSIRVENNKSNITISGGTFNTDKSIFTPEKGTSVDGANVTLKGGTFNSNLKSNANWNGLNLTIESGIYAGDDVLDYVGEYDVVVKSGNKYAVNESGYDLAKPGETVEIVKVPNGTEIDGVPAGVKIVNNSGNTITINGKEIADGESYFEPLPATPTVTSDAPMFKYMVVEGKDQTWTKSANSDALNYVLNADAKNLVKVLIDGEEVEFEIDENGEVVISAEVLEKLDAGEYEIEFIFADGSCKTKLFVK